MTKHTQGPWTAKNGEVWGEGNPLCCVFRTEAWSDGDPVGYDDQANIRLITAAPDLLAALQELVSQRDAHFHTVSAWDTARAAIAKATSE